MKKILLILVLLLISCKKHESEKSSCLFSMKILRGELKSTSFAFENNFIPENNFIEQKLTKLKSKYGCLSDLNPIVYSKNNDYLVIVLSRKNNSGAILVINNGTEKLIEINDFNNYEFKGISLEDEILSIYLKQNNNKQKINFQIKNDYVFWNNYEF